jgi:hypothetical protein
MVQGGDHLGGDGGMPKGYQEYRPNFNPFGIGQDQAHHYKRIKSGMPPEHMIGEGEEIVPFFFSAGSGLNHRIHAQLAMGKAADTDPYFDLPGFGHGAPHLIPRKECGAETRPLATASWEV